MPSKNDSTVRYCKECGCELASTNKHKRCDNCRREKARKIKAGVAAFGVAAATVGPVILKLLLGNGDGGGDSNA